MVMMLRLILVALCLAGAWISAELVRAHAGPWPGMDGTPGLLARWCGEGSGAESGCAAVVKGKWSAFDVTVPVVTSSLTITRQRIVVPVAFVGLAYFVLLGAWFALAGDPARYGRLYILPLLLVVGGAFGSVTLMGIMYAKLDSRCTLCILTHAINALVVLVLLALRPRRRSRSDRGMAGPQATGAGWSNDHMLTPAAVLRITGFAVIMIVSMWIYRGAKLETRRQVAKLLPYREFVDQRTHDPAFLMREFYSEPAWPIGAAVASEEGHAVESVATVTIFTDFQCPHCACFAHKWKTEYRGRLKGPIRLVVRHLPLSKKCNDALRSDLHPEACDASYAAEAARLQGGDEAFWDMHDLLFKSIRRLDTKPFEALATSIGLDGGRLLADMDDPSIRQAIARDVALASDLGIDGTPAVFFNGRRVPDYCLHNPVFWEAISTGLQRRASAATVATWSAALAAAGHEDAIRSTRD